MKKYDKDFKRESDQEIFGRSERGFHSRFKAELVEGGIFESVEQARLEIFSYIEGFYNRIWRHSSLGYLSPLEARKTVKN